MKLKCIGGEWDGKYWNVEDRYKIHDVIRMPPRIVPPVDFSSAIEPTITLNYLIYRVACFHFSKDDIHKFLVTEYPVKWTDKQAILHQFAK